MVLRWKNCTMDRKLPSSKVWLGTIDTSLFWNFGEPIPSHGWSGPGSGWSTTSINNDINPSIWYACVCIYIYMYIYICVCVCVCVLCASHHIPANASIPKIPHNFDGHKSRPQSKKTWLIFLNIPHGFFPLKTFITSPIHGCSWAASEVVEDNQPRPPRSGRSDPPPTSRPSAV